MILNLFSFPSRQKRVYIWPTDRDPELFVEANKLPHPLMLEFLYICANRRFTVSPHPLRASTGFTCQGRDARWAGGSGVGLGVFGGDSCPDTFKGFKKCMVVKQESNREQGRKTDLQVQGTAGFLL